MEPKNLYAIENFERPSSIIAQDLIGKIILTSENKYAICETGAFEGITSTKRTKLEDFTKNPGQIYVHSAYSTYTLAINTDKKETPSVITIRAIAPVGDLSIILGPRDISKKLSVDRTINDKIINVTTPFFITNDIVDAPFKVIANRPKNVAENVICFYYLKRL